MEFLRSLQSSTVEIEAKEHGFEEIRRIRITGNDFTRLVVSNVEIHKEAA
jgi:hypothetical protein